MILAGDIGGTKTVLGWYEQGSTGLECMKCERFSSSDHEGLVPILEGFLEPLGERPERACFGVAGPVMEGVCEATNLPWVVDEESLRRLLHVDQVAVINDLEATAHGIAGLGDSELLVLQMGVDRPGNRALIAAGTGLGESLLMWNGTSHDPCPSEGGHSDFAPRNDWEVGLLRYMSERFGHVSYERILSGDGFFHLYEFVKAQGRSRPAEAVGRALVSAPDRNAVISRAGVEMTCPVCVEVLERFVEIYGAEAGNLALKGLATGGVYVAGGIAPHIVSSLVNGRFLEGFSNKGRFRDLLEAIPIRVILSPEAALRGAAQYARRLR